MSRAVVPVLPHHAIAPLLVLPLPHPQSLAIGFPRIVWPWGVGKWRRSPGAGLPAAATPACHSAGGCRARRGNKSLPEDNVRHKQKEFQDLEACHKESTDLISQRLVEIRRLHQERIEILNKLVTFQTIMLNLTEVQVA